VFCMHGVFLDGDENEDLLQFGRVEGGGMEWKRAGFDSPECVSVVERSGFSKEARIAYSFEGRCVRCAGF